MSSKAPTIRASRRATTRRAKKTRRGLRARARCCEFEVRQLAELKQHTPNVGGVQSHAATNHVQQVEHVTKEPMNGAQPEHCKHHLLLHYHSTKPMRQTTTQSGWKRNMQKAAPKKHCTCSGVVDSGAKARRTRRWRARLAPCPRCGRREAWHHSYPTAPLLQSCSAVSHANRSHRIYPFL